jgi:hypothetical protein
LHGDIHRFVSVKRKDAAVEQLVSLVIIACLEPLINGFLIESMVLVAESQSRVDPGLRDSEHLADEV